MAIGVLVVGLTQTERRIEVAQTLDCAPLLRAARHAQNYTSPDRDHHTAGSIRRSEARVLKLYTARQYNE